MSETTEQRILTLEERVTLLEDELDAQREGAAAVARAAGTPEADVAAGQPEDPLLADAIDRVEEVVSSGGGLDIESVVAAAFANVPEFGALDAEFGGVVLTGGDPQYELVLVRNGLAYTETAAVALTAMGFETAVAEGLVGHLGAEAFEAESVDGFVVAAASSGEDELRIVLTLT